MVCIASTNMPLFLPRFHLSRCCFHCWGYAPTGRKLNTFEVPQGARSGCASWLVCSATILLNDCTCKVLASERQWRCCKSACCRDCGISFAQTSTLPHWPPAIIIAILSCSPFTVFKLQIQFYSVLMYLKKKGVLDIEKLVVCEREKPWMVLTSHDEQWLVEPFLRDPVTVICFFGSVTAWVCRAQK